IASSGVAAGLSIVGYVSGNNVVQSAETVRGIYYLCNGVPAVCYALCLIGIGLIFNLNKKTTDRMYEEMAAKRAAQAQ
ncbi:MAG: MFS transporter, partial [Oscillospiraceae bacterium]|nr:MFS transporter [Oscillospiraceae bacterium]